MLLIEKKISSKYFIIESNMQEKMTKCTFSWKLLPKLSKHAQEKTFLHLHSGCRSEIKTEITEIPLPPHFLNEKISTKGF